MECVFQHVSCVMATHNVVITVMKATALTLTVSLSCRFHANFRFYYETYCNNALKSRLSVSVLLVSILVMALLSARVVSVGRSVAPSLMTTSNGILPEICRWTVVVVLSDLVAPPAVRLAGSTFPPLSECLTKRQVDMCAGSCCSCTLETWPRRHLGSRRCFSYDRPSR